MRGTQSSTPNISFLNKCAAHHVHHVCGHHGRYPRAPVLDHARKHDVAEVLATGPKGDWHKPVSPLPDISVSNGAVYGFLSEHGGSVGGSALWRYSLRCAPDSALCILNRLHVARTTTRALRQPSIWEGHWFLPGITPASDVWDDVDDDKPKVPLAFFIVHIAYLEDLLRRRSRPIPGQRYVLAIQAIIRALHCYSTGLGQAHSTIERELPVQRVLVRIRTILYLRMNYAIVFSYYRLEKCKSAYCTT
ncbi:hypothetical protein C8F01DRAFT_1371829 [Mycena amicta]|nr:hypothetical protein C8F01DRAFT_1371829 [Mycena amicta]